MAETDPRGRREREPGARGAGAATLLAWVLSVALVAGAARGGGEFAPRPGAALGLALLPFALLAGFPGRRRGTGWALALLLPGAVLAARIDLARGAASEATWMGLGSGLAAVGVLAAAARPGAGYLCAWSLAVPGLLLAALVARQAAGVELGALAALGPASGTWARALTGSGAWSAVLAPVAGALLLLGVSRGLSRRAGGPE